MLTRLAISAALLAALSAPLQAQGRPDARQMTCDQARALIDERGAVVLTTGRHTYDRYVAHNGYCMHLEVATPISIVTRDTDQCLVYHCRARSDDGFWNN